MKSLSIVVMERSQAMGNAFFAPKGDVPPTREPVCRWATSVASVFTS